MITDPAYPSPRDKDKGPNLGLTKLEEATLRIFCASMQTPGLMTSRQLDLEAYMDGCIAAAKNLLTKIEAAQR